MERSALEGIMKAMLLVLLLLPAVGRADSSPVHALVSSVRAAPFEINYDRPGGDYFSFDLLAPRAILCQERCARDPRCRAWTYVKPGVQGRYARCWLKNTIPPGRFSTCCVSGTKGGSRATGPGFRALN